ncbi:NEW3 domain-containing protein [Actinocatenispora sera]|uniref:NEW3 domain-containing protein n=1 Tax=Actinocatenispora sera TaxID=390989 RepID=UPI0033CE92F9
MAVLLAGSLATAPAQASPGRSGSPGWGSPADSWLPQPNETPPDNGLALTPPMIFNAWMTKGCNISQQTFVDAANTLVDSGLAAAGYDYVAIDDCWSAAERDADGNLVADPAKFPNGMRWLGDYLHARGLKFGIYEDAGTTTCAGYPGSWGHFQQDADTFASWGVDLLKFDGCNLPSIAGQTADQVLETAYTRMAEALRASGRPIAYFESAPWYAHDLPAALKWASRIGNLWYNPANGSVESARYAGPGHWNFATTLAPQLSSSLAEKRAAVSMAAELASPLVFSADMATLTAAQAKVLANPAVIAVDQDPYGAQGTSVGHQGDVQVRSKPLANGDISVLFSNNGDTSERASLTAAQAGFSIDAPAYSLDNLWTGTKTQSAGTISADVPPHGVVMYRVTPLRKAAPTAAPATDLAVRGSGFSTGSTGPVTVTVTNDGVQSLKHVTLSVTLPSGGTVTPTSPVAVPEIAPGASWQATFTVTVAAAPAGGEVEIDATAVYRVPPTPSAPSGPKRRSHGAGFSPSLTPYAHLSDGFDNVGITSDSDTVPAGLDGGFDGSGGTYSQESLDAATGLNGAVLSDGASPGATIDYQGTRFTMPDVPASRKDNLASAGQIISLHGTGEAVALLAAGAGAASGTITINYTDGSSSAATISVPSWYYSGQATGSAVPVVQTLGRNAGKGHVHPNYSFDLYEVTAPIAQGRTVASVVLPDNRKLHVFDLALAARAPVKPVFASVEQAYDNIAITDEAAPNPPALNGGFDGGGSTFSQQALNAATGLDGATLSDGASPGATITYGGTVLTMPDVPAGEVDNVVAAGQTIKISGTGSAVALLASGAGAATGTVTVTYTDETTSSTQVSVPSWYFHGQATGDAVPVVQTFGRNKSTGLVNTAYTYDLYLLSVPVPAGRTVDSVTLPDNGQLHVFAMTVTP